MYIDMSKSLSLLLETEFYNDVCFDTKEIVIADRFKHKEIFDIIRKYCSENDIIVSNVHHLIRNNTSIECKNLDDLMYIKDFNYQLYADNPLYHANNLINYIHKELTDNTKYKEILDLLRLKTVQKKKEFSIEFDFRIVANIYKIQKQKDKTLTEYIRPVVIDNLKFLPPEIEIIDVYHNMYDLEKNGNVSTNILRLHAEEKLYEQIAVRKDKNMLGGNECKNRRKELIEYIKLSLVSQWLKDRDDICLIGSWAYDWLKNEGKICVNREKIQIISKLQVESISVSIEKFVKPMTNFQITYKEQQLNIPKDFRTKRYTFYINIETERGIVEKPFLDLFNSAEFEIIPFAIFNGICIGDKYVILRFLYIDLWILRLIYALGIITNDIINMKIDHYWFLINEFRGNYGDKLKTTNFFGIYRNYLVDKKQENLKGKKYTPYIPSIYLAENNTYREL
jgi:hypothetical protein